VREWAGVCVRKRPERIGVTGPVVAYQHGIFPRSEDLVAATRGLERGRVARPEVDARFDADLESFVLTQREAGLDYYSDGMLRWQDLFRPLVDACSGTAARTLVRWFDNNSFFRAPEIVGALRTDGDFSSVAPSSVVPEPCLACLPSPYLFSRAAGAAGNRNDLMAEIARYVLRPAVEGIVELGCRLVHLQEPWLAYFGIRPEDWSAFERALVELREAAPADRATLVLHTYFGDAAPFADRLRGLPVDAVGFDLVETDWSALHGPWEGGLLLGCLDGRSSVVEPVEGSVRLIQSITDSLEPAALYLSSNCELELLPAEIARRKVLRLGEIARQIREAS
jgi:5-methyltetrahydropteroyltriglutamate--homocysteine methyltransferase